tara:strand:+ start:1249 stop:1464 length:216 start_codon:yes stop_codon:yes gene_type:complete
MKIITTYLKEGLKMPNIEIGDEIFYGKFKNRTAVVKGITTNDKGQPTLLTDKGEINLLKIRIKKLLPKKKK